MKIGIISDVHANLEALHAVWHLFDAERVDTVWCLGDTVGYGANPSECLSEVRQRCSLFLKGNHDEAAATLRNLEWFNEWARESAIWTHTQLSEQELEFLESLQPKKQVQIEAFGFKPIWLVHGSLRDPLSEYILNAQIAAENIDLLKRQVPTPSDFPTLLFFGHSHVAEAYYIPSTKSKKLRHQRFLVTADMQLQIGGIYLINVGCVGQPRDGNPYASCGIFDTANLALRVFRIPYDVEKAAIKILRAGLPQELALRLFQGW